MQAEKLSVKKAFFHLTFSYSQLTAFRKEEICLEAMERGPQEEEGQEQEEGEAREAAGDSVA